nr:hypothetical protein [Caulerpa lentillifera]
MQFDHSIHKRYWISEYSKRRIPLPPLNIQKNIVKQIIQKKTLSKNIKMKLLNMKMKKFVIYGIMNSARQNKIICSTSLVLSLPRWLWDIPYLRIVRFDTHKSVP